MDIIYMQCDMRFNKLLMHEFGHTTVIGYVVNRFAGLVSEHCVKIAADLYDCSENAGLAEYLSELGVEVHLSPIENITERLIDYCERLESGCLVIRVLGEQVLLNMQYFHELYDGMKCQNTDFYYYKNNDGQVPEIFKLKILVEHKDEVKKMSRYYEVFDRLRQLLNEYVYEYDAMPVRILASNQSMIHLLEKYYLNQDIDVLKAEVSEAVYRMGDNNSYLVTSGFLQSVITKEVRNAAYEAVPWFTYQMIDFLSERLKKDMDVFEFGCGYSTFFYAAKCRSVKSVEHDLEWYYRIDRIKPENVEISHIELVYGGEYCSSVLKTDMLFDVICVDGRDRVRCACNAVKALKKDGVIIFDDSRRKDYKEAYVYLKQQGFRRIDFKGLIPSLVNSLGCTSVFYRKENCMEI